VFCWNRPARGDFSSCCSVEKRKFRTFRPPHPSTYAAGRGHLLTPYRDRPTSRVRLAKLETLRSTRGDAGGRALPPAINARCNDSSRFPSGRRATKLDALKSKFSRAFSRLPEPLCAPENDSFLPAPVHGPCPFVKEANNTGDSAVPAGMPPRPANGPGQRFLEETSCANAGTAARTAFGGTQPHAF